MVRSNKIIKKQGVTLVELLIALLIVAILAMAAYPSYSSYVQRVERKKAASVLLALAAQLERIRSQQLSYSSPSIIDSAGLRYSISVFISNDKNSYVLAADPAAYSSQSDDKCGVMSLSNKGVWSFSTAATQDECL